MKSLQILIASHFYLQNDGYHGEKLPADSQTLTIVYLFPVGQIPRFTLILGLKRGSFNDV